MIYITHLDFLRGERQLEAQVLLLALLLVRLFDVFRDLQRQREKCRKCCEEEKKTNRRRFPRLLLLQLADHLAQLTLEPLGPRHAAALLLKQSHSLEFTHLFRYFLVAPNTFWRLQSQIKLNLAEMIRNLKRGF